MKKFIIIAFIAYTSLTSAATDITPPNMELGHWITTIDQSAIIEQALASLPEESRVMALKMMKEKMQSSTRSEQCITKDALRNFDKSIKDTFSDINKKDCSFDVTESTNKKFAATMTCPGTVTQITTDVINSKRNESTIVIGVGAAEKTLKAVSEWKSSVCP